MYGDSNEIIVGADKKLKTNLLSVVDWIEDDRFYCLKLNKTKYLLDYLNRHGNLLYEKTVGRT